MNEENTNIEVNHENLQKALSLLAWKHDEVREELVENPRAAIEKHLGIKLNDDLKVNIVSHTDPKELTFILPCDYHKVTDNELSDEDLEKAAGGFGNNFMSSIIGMCRASFNDAFKDTSQQ